MKKPLNLALALAAGLLGGLLSRYIAPQSALAQSPAPSTKEIQAQSFVFVAPDGHPLATLTPDPAWLKAARLMAELSAAGRISSTPFLSRFSGRIVLLDSNEREIWSAGGSPFRAPSER
jgi:hypothetical protein